MPLPIVNNIFQDANALSALWPGIFQFQYDNNTVYRNWCNALSVNAKTVADIIALPFLPIGFFKTHKVVCNDFLPEMIFESSGTTGTLNSRHFIKETAVYIKSFEKCFDLFYGNIEEYCVIGLLPSYLERQNSSLVLMVDELMKKSVHPKSGFYLYNFAALKDTITQLEAAHQKTILIGVTYALLDFAEQYPLNLGHTIVMETGGMKGRKKELTKNEMHAALKTNLGLKNVHSEYGMTELLSQAYSAGNGRFYCPPWMKVLVRNEQDPMQVSEKGKGILNIIDLANIYSCSFIATDDIGEVFEDGSFEVWGRIDNSDIRGCSLMVI